MYIDRTKIEFWVGGVYLGEMGCSTTCDSPPTLKGELSSSEGHGQADRLTDPELYLWQRLNGDRADARAFQDSVGCQQETSTRRRV